MCPKQCILNIIVFSLPSYIANDLVHHPPQTPRGYCAANTEDLREVVDHVINRYPGVPIVGVGVSLGA